MALKLLSIQKTLLLLGLQFSNDNPLVNVSFSKNNGNSFGAPVKVNDHDAIGRGRCFIFK